LHPDEVPLLASAAGLQVEKIALFNNPLTNGHMKTELLLRLLPQDLVHGMETTTQLLPLWLRKRVLLQMGVRLCKSLKAAV
jgi:hypothetical protein